MATNDHLTKKVNQTYAKNNNQSSSSKQCNNHKENNATKCAQNTDTPSVNVYKKYDQNGFIKPPTISNQPKKYYKKKFVII